MCPSSLLLCSLRRTHGDVRSKVTALNRGPGGDDSSPLVERGSAAWLRWLQHISYPLSLCRAIHYAVIRGDNSRCYHWTQGTTGGWAPGVLPDSGPGGPVEVDQPNTRLHRGLRCNGVVINTGTRECISQVSANGLRSFHTWPLQTKCIGNNSGRLGISSKCTVDMYLAGNYTNSVFQPGSHSVAQDRTSLKTK